MAIEKALLQKAGSGYDIKNVDILDYTNAFFKFSYPTVYLFLINRTPFLWGVLYYLLDIPIVDLFVTPLRRFLHNLNSKKFIDFICGYNPDIVISTHFLPSDIISSLKRKKQFSGKLITVITDLLPHCFWLAWYSDYFTAGIEKTKKELLRRGIREDKIKVLGIPCDPVFAVSDEKETVLKKLGLELNYFNILIMSGGFGTGPIREIVDNASMLRPDIKEKIQIIVICGRNENLVKALNKRAEKLRLRARIFGYMDNVNEFMSVSDLIITKPGGLTISEALSKNLPMIIVQPIPGQESRNCKILEGYGAAVKVNKIKEVNSYIEEFLTKPEKIFGMKTRIMLLAYPDSAEKIAEFALCHNS